VDKLVEKWKFARVGGDLLGVDLGENFVTLEIADGIKVKLQKGAISAVLPKGTLKSA